MQSNKKCPNGPIKVSIDALLAPMLMAGCVVLMEPSAIHWAKIAHIEVDRRVYKMSKEKGAFEYKKAMHSAYVEC